MSGYTICALTDVPDIFGGQYPGAMRFLTDHLEAEQIAFTHRVMPPQSGGKGSYGHRHKTQEEIYFVTSGNAAIQARRRDLRHAQRHRRPRRPRARPGPSGTTGPTRPSW